MNTQLRIAEILKEKGMTIEALKDKIEENGESLSRTSISKIIHDKSVPKIDTLQLIADALEIPITRLFDIKEKTIHLIIDNNLKTFYSLEEVNEYLKSIQ